MRPAPWTLLVNQSFLSEWQVDSSRWRPSAERTGAGKRNSVYGVIASAVILAMCVGLLVPKLVLDGLNLSFVVRSVSFRRQRTVQRP
jgi:hypothetical protein